MLKPATIHLPLFVVLIITSLILIPSSTEGLAAPAVDVWTPVNIPTQGAGGNWQLAAGSDIQLITTANDGTLYVCANAVGFNCTLLKSTDKGLTWMSAGQLNSSIIALAVASDDNKLVYYVTNNTVYRSSNAGANFSAFALNPGGAGSNNVTITSLAVSLLNNSRIVAVGTRDTDTGQFGGVYTINESEPSTNWSDTAMKNCDVLSVAFSPRYTIDRQMIVTGSSENGTVVAFRNGNGGWGTSSGNVTIGGVAAENCVVAFPGDYDGTLFLGIDTGDGGGDVYRINRVTAPANSTAVDLNIGIGDNKTSMDVSGLAVNGVSGSYYLVAGAANSTKIYISGNGGQNWTRCAKNPTGESGTIIIMSPDFASSRRVYAGSSGAGSAFSYSVDSGVTWNQLSIIDTTIDAIVDFAASPAYGWDNTLFLLTWGGEHSLWRTENRGDNWERVYSGSLGGGSSFSYLRLSPQYGSNGSVVVLAGSLGDGTIWKSNDKGQTFVRRRLGFTIDTMALADNDQYFMSSYNGTNNLVYRTTDGGATLGSPATAGEQPLSSLILSPMFLKDRTILAGNSNGRVFLSTDSGAAYQEIFGGSDSPSLGGNIFTAFDWRFDSTRIIYAVSDNSSTSSARSRMYRYTLGKSQQWENLDSTLEIGGKLGQLCVLPGGSLYVANSHDNGGIERSLNPGAASYPVFERMNSGLSNRAALWGLWGAGNQLWSIDSRNTKLLTYVDSLTAPVVPGNPIAGASGVDTRSVTLDWGGLAGAITYEWQVDNDGSFSSVSSLLKGETGTMSVRLPNLDPATTYYWRVRVKAPSLSPWSATRYFYTLLGSPGNLPTLNSPKAAADGVAIRPVFQWETISRADNYELLVATNYYFANPVIAKVGALALPTNAWQCDTNLSYNTTYYWKIRGVNENSSSVWSGVGTFTTLVPPVLPPPPLASFKARLLTPKTGVQGVGIKPVFEWESVPGVDHYELLVSYNRSFADAVIVKVGVGAVQGTIWQSDINLEFRTTYYWKVRGVNGNSYSAWSDDYYFTTTAPEKIPDPPPKIAIELVFPSPGSEGISIKPIFQWKAVSGFERYELLVSNDYSFDHQVIQLDGVNAVPAAVWQSEIGLSYETKYYWKVRAVSGVNASAWSDINAFITVNRPVAVVPAIELENPVAGADRVSVRPVFQWKAVTGAERYELLVSASYTFTDPVIVETGNNSLSLNAWRSDTNLAADTLYYWKIRAVNSANMSVWSNVSAFTTERLLLQTETKAVVKESLPCVTLDSTLSKAGRHSTKPLFSWGAVAGAEKYELLVSPDIAFAKPSIIRVGSYAVPGTSWQSEVDLNYDTTYWWKVRAVSENKAADWSVPGVFITEPRPPQALALDKPVLPPWVIYIGATLTGLIILLGASVLTLLSRVERD